MSTPARPPLVTSDAAWRAFRATPRSPIAPPAPPPPATPQPMHKYVPVGTHLCTAAASEASPEGLLRLADAAAEACNAPRLSVVDKPAAPPSGDLHDYASQAPYWWPDPASPDGLPYLRRDGEVNPEFYGTDRDRLAALCDRVTVLTLHHHATGDIDSARAAGRALRTWFLDDATRMNPNLRHAQRVPGHCDGRGIGIIDTTPFCYLLDVVRQLPFGDTWTPADLTALQAWFSAYIDWLLESDHGRDECKEHNNHGTWYDAQVACFAVFCGRDEIARAQIERFTRARIVAQLAADGSQPHELARTLSLSYCTYNLSGFAVLAQLSRRLGDDLWTWRPADGGAASLAQAFRWMLPYYCNEQPWTWPQIGRFDPAGAAFPLALAADATHDADFETTFIQLARLPWSRISNWRPASLDARRG